MTTLNIAMAQANLLVGAIEDNANKIIQMATQARDQQKADLIIFPELSLIGYPPEDLLLRNGLYPRICDALQKIKATIQDIAIVIGFPDLVGDTRYNAAQFIYNGEILGQYYKQQLPNYGVFDEARYFEAGSQPCLVEFKGFRLSLAICEDLWHPWQMNQAKMDGAELVLHLNASPFHQQKMLQRQTMMKKVVIKNKLPLVYVNYIGGQDDLVFDGGSMVINQHGEICAQAPFFEECIVITLCEKDQNNQLQLTSQTMNEVPETTAATYQALTLGLKDYVRKNGFTGILLGLSGGIDSALTLAIAADALGNENVFAYRLPSQYTANISMEDAELQTKMMNVELKTLLIEPLYHQCIHTLQEVITLNEECSQSNDTTKENLQARIRGILLMAISNKTGKLVLSTGNKSELAVGYSTLYGDMVGGFAPLKDISKTQVYELSRYRNSITSIIPERVLTRAPSAELRHEQTDQDSLPPYEILDDILERYIEKDEPLQTIIASGHDASIVNDIIMKARKNEYKRRQAAPGTKVTARAFGRDRRYPITEGYTRQI